MTWPPEKVASWLEMIDFAQYKPVFKKFNGRAMVRLSENQTCMLVEEFSRDKADAILMWQNIQELKDLALYCSIHATTTTTTTTTTTAPCEKEECSETTW